MGALKIILTVAVCTPLLFSAIASTAKQDNVMVEDMTEAEIVQWYEQREALYDAHYDILESLSDQDLAQLLWREERANYFRGLDRMSFHAPAYNTEYQPAELNRLNDYADSEALMNAYLGSLTALQNDFEPRCSRLGSQQALQLDTGFEFPFRYQLHYYKATLANDDILPFFDESNPARAYQSVVKSGDAYCILNSAKKPLAPQSVSANFRAQLPGTMIEFEFSAEDLGKTLTQQGYSLTVQAWQDNRFEVYIGTPTNDARQRFRPRDVVAEAQASNGHYLTWHATRRRPMAEVPLVDEVVHDLIRRAQQNDVDVDEARAELEALQRQFNQEQSSRLYFARAYNGDIDKVRMTLMIYEEGNPVIEEQLQLPVQQLVTEVPADADVEQALAELDITSAVYDKRVSVNAERAELPADEMDNLVEQSNFTLFDPSSLRPGDYPKQIAWFYPPLRSDLLLNRQKRVIKTSASMLLFLDDQGKPLIDPAIEAFYADLDGDIHYASELNFGGIEAPFMAARLDYDPELWPDRPASITGKISLVTAPNMRQVQYAIDELPSGLTFTGNRLTVDLDVFNAPEVESIKKDTALIADYQLMAKDEHGYLAVLREQSVYVPDEREPRYQTYYFYGQPETIEVWYPGELDIVDFTVETEL
ncbi:hypothetical protein CWE12_06060 [Aliidiomarina sedimenti]|uniref:Uncharacterized protein n=1 Tax=Aliidiomarina sedimenti TaxID=1933879 RepID=A0ABY0C0U4_9GAMM|nr:hypothetical protein [Aliidiomarina sedimenti]RUO30798.1 hypothetical protein CWE12_06060 [Aliidiomarina sedimenti]